MYKIRVQIYHPEFSEKIFLQHTFDGCGCNIFHEDHDVVASVMTPFSHYFSQMQNYQRKESPEGQVHEERPT